jgi:hypothetical protein
VENDAGGDDGEQKMDERSSNKDDKYNEIIDGQLNIVANAAAADDDDEKPRLAAGKLILMD